jgi:hypothetical protein
MAANSPGILLCKGEKEAILLLSQLPPIWWHICKTAMKHFLFMKTSTDKQNGMIMTNLMTHR